MLCSGTCGSDGTWTHDLYRDRV